MTNLTPATFALIFVAVTYLIAAVAIVNLGKGAPEWHMVPAPGATPVAGQNSQTELPHREHRPIKIRVSQEVLVDEPIYVFNGKEQVQIGSVTTRKRVEKIVTAYWRSSSNCYAYTDEQGRLVLVPELR